MERQVQVIAPKVKSKYLYGKNPYLTHQKRVAAYCRVSSDKDQQLNSFDNQVEEWTKRLESDPEVILVGIYADEGISGTSEDRRTEFQRMINDARAGKIDKIVTKSISRFARNVQTSIDIARELKALGVEIYFDNEHISTLDPSSEVMFTLSAIMAQEESRHISDNVKWTFDKNKKEGIPMVSSNLLGYRRDPNNPKNLIVIPEEAEIVKLLFKLYTDEVGTNEICRILESKGYLTRRGLKKWYNTTVEGIITNEKYCGDLLLQKSVTIDFLKHKRIKNDGLEEQVYIKNNHEPIVDRDTWDRAQLILERNRNRFRGENKDSHKYASKYPLSGMLVCIHCGDTFKRRHWTQGYPEPRIVFQCSGYIDGEPHKRCPSKAISEDILLKTTCEVINRIYLSGSRNYNKVIANISKHHNEEYIQQQIDDALDKQKTIESEIDDIIRRKQSATDDVEKIILDKQYRERVSEYQRLDKLIFDLTQKQQDIEYAKIRIQKMGETLKGEKLTPDKLTKPIVETFIQAIIVNSKTDIVFVLPNSEKLNYQSIKDKRYELVDREAIIDGNVKLDRHFRPEQLHYKVVMM